MPNPFIFQGGIYDSSTQSYYTGSDYYDPATGQSFGCKDLGPVDPLEDRCGEDENPTCNGVCNSKNPDWANQSSSGGAFSEDFLGFEKSVYGKYSIEQLHRIDVLYLTFDVTVLYDLLHHFGPKILPLIGMIAGVYEQAFLYAGFKCRKYRYVTIYQYTEFGFPVWFSSVCSYT